MRFISTFILSLFLFGCSASPAEPDDAIPVRPSSSLEASTPEQQEPRLECENTSGIIGSADISFDGTTVLVFYEKPNASAEPAQTLRFYDDIELKMYSFKAEGKRSYGLLRPESHKLDYYVFDLAVRSRRNSWLEVHVDDETNETLWLRETKKVKFEDWLQKMKSSFAVGRRTKESNPLRNGPDSASEEVSFVGKDCFEVVDMKGDWIKVNVQNHCTEAPKQSVSGWLRWRNESGCLLVEIFPFA